MKAKKLASGKFSITDISPEDAQRFLDAVEEQRKRYRFSSVPERKGEEVRQKMDLIADDYEVMCEVIGEAIHS